MELCSLQLNRDLGVSLRGSFALAPFIQTLREGSEQAYKKQGLHLISILGAAISESRRQ